MKAAFCVMLLLTPSAIRAQPSQSDCQAYAAALASGAQWGVGWERIHECGTAGSAALASAIANSAPKTDSAFLIPLISYAGSLQSSDIFDAAEELFATGTATVAARVMALFVVLGQWNPQITIAPQMSWTSLTTVPWGSVCKFSPGIGHGFSASLSAPTPTQLGFAATGFTNAANSTSEPPVIRDLARCARQALKQDVPLVPNTSNQFIFLVYVCGTRFRVENDNPMWVPVTWRVVGTTEEGGFSLPPAGTPDRTFFTTNVGTVEILYAGQVIHSQPNGGTICPP